MSSYGYYINPDSTSTRTSRKRRTPNASKNGKPTKPNKSIFKVEKGCSGKRRKHILNFEQISVLENYFHIDPDWKTTTVGKLHFLFYILYFNLKFLLMVLTVLNRSSSYSTRPSSEEDL